MWEATLNGSNYEYTHQLGPYPAQNPYTHVMPLHAQTGTANGKLVIVHHGHTTPQNAADLSDYKDGGAGQGNLSALGYDIIEINMFGRSVGGTVGNTANPFATNHDNHFRGLGRDAWVYHFCHILSIVNKVYKDYDSIAMIGKSGGGWATSIYAALDSRIKASFPLCGTTPMYLRRNDGGITGSANDGRGDSEQYLSDLYSVASHIDMYILGASNGLQHQFNNSNDTCCFQGNHVSEWKQFVQMKAARFGGSFDISVVSGAAAHEVPDAIWPTVQAKLAAM